jgi:hypothetical protein
MMTKNKIFTIILSLLGFFWVLYPFIIFFIKIYTVLYFLFIVTFIVQVFYLMRFSDYSFIKICLKFYKYLLENFYNIPLNTFYNKIIKNIPGIGTLLLFICNIFSILYSKVGFYRIRIFSTIFFILPNVILGIIIFLRVFINWNISMYIIILLIIFVRLAKSIYFVLSDFCLQNKRDLDKYLIISQVAPKQYAFIFNTNTVNIKKRTKENLEFYTARYVLFKEMYSLLQSTLDYKNDFIRPWLNPLFLSILFSSNLKILCSLYNYNLNIYILILSFFIVFSIEHFNIYQQHKQ